MGWLLLTQKDWIHLESSFLATVELVPNKLELKVENPLLPRPGDERILGITVQTLELEVSRFPLTGLILTILALGLGVSLVAYFFCTIKTEQILLLACALMLIMTLYWQLNRLSALLLPGWLLLGALITALLTLYRRAFVSSSPLYLKFLTLAPVLLLAGWGIIFYHNSLDYSFFSDSFHPTSIKLSRKNLKGLER